MAESTGKADTSAKDAHPPSRPYRESDSKGDTEPPGGKRGEEGDEKPIGRIVERGDKRESPPAYRKGNTGRQCGNIASRQTE